MFKNRENTNEPIFVFENVARVIQSEWEWENATKGTEEKDWILMLEIIEPDTFQPMMMYGIPFKNTNLRGTIYGNYLFYVVKVEYVVLVKDRKEHPEKYPGIISPLSSLSMTDLA